jgi:hypothetical protein
MKYITEPILFYIEETSGNFGYVVISKEDILDLTGEGEKLWGVNFTKKYLSESLINWLKINDFEVHIKTSYIESDCGEFSYPGIFYYIVFTDEKTKLEFILKFT